MILWLDSGANWRVFKVLEIAFKVVHGWGARFTTVGATGGSDLIWNVCGTHGTAAVANRIRAMACRYWSWGLRLLTSDGTHVLFGSFHVQNK